ncbi:MAG: hypothetical protein IRZ16_05460 [Myxococcaceae bacterium]|nr:hypothetical protein [Myxococcaceae bacterium]
MRFTFAVLALLALLRSSLASAEAAPAGCERVVVVPLEPSGLTPDEALEEEEALRALIARNLSVCVQPRAKAVEVLRTFEGLRLPVCTDAACRKALARKFDADWLVSGTAYGFGGGHTVAITLWPADGNVVQRGTYASGSALDERQPAETVIALFHDARLGRSIANGVEAVAEPARPRRSRWPEVALGTAAVAALAGGVAFASASQLTAERISRQRTGCAGQGEAYVRCFEDTVQAGKNQALAANVLFGAGALFGAGVAVVFMVELP